MELDIIIYMISLILVCAYVHKQIARIILPCSIRISVLSIVFFALFAFAAPADSYALFEELTDKGIEIFTGMREIIYVVAGFGIIGIAVGGFFGNLNWKWLGAVIIGLVIIAVTAAFINYVAGEDVVEVQDTLR